MRYFLAIDAGGTKTECVLADERQELARVETGSIKRLRVGAEEAQRNLTTALAQLSADTGISAQSLASTCIGTSGASVPLVRDWVVAELRSLVGGQIEVCGDEEIALDAAFKGGPGVLVVAGTGSIVAGRTGDGHLVRAGGWGPVLAEEGSGHWIGHQALRAAFRAIDEGVSSTLLARVEEHWQLTGRAQLVEKANSSPAPDFSQLTMLVVACAEAGDAVASGVLKRGGEELAFLALMVIRQLRDREGDGFVLPTIAMTGSILSRVAPVKQAMVAALRRAHAKMAIIDDPVDPIQGALWRARGVFLKD